MKTKRQICSSTALFAVLLLTACAQQVAPTGGPPDKTPPRIVQVVPAPKSTRVPLDQEIEFTFSESMDHKSLRKAVFITPNPHENVRYKWKGRRLRVILGDALKPDRTYVVTLGTDLKDAHGNALRQSYTLAFSTGEELSEGKISGRVFGKQVSGTLVWAYILENGHDPNPVSDEPDYVTQTDAKGRFEFTNLSQGEYRVFAVQDKDRNRFYEPGTDALGVPTRDLTLTEGNLEENGLNFRLTFPDSTRPALLDVSAEDNRHLLLEFDEALSPAGVEVLGNYRIKPKKSSSTDSLRVRLAYLSARNAQEVHLATEPQRAKVTYELRVQNLTDLAGNVVDPDYNTAEFVGSALPDTLGPKLLSTVPRDSAQAVPDSGSIVLHFSEPVEPGSLEAHLHLLDSTGTHVAGHLRWLTPASAAFSAGSPLKGSAWYRVQVALDSVLDLQGNPGADSTFRLAFRTVNPDTFSVIRGKVIDEDSTATGPIILQIRQSGKNAHQAEVRLAQPGPYEFSAVFPGTYALEAFRDRDENGRYSYGSALPFVPAERFVIYADSVKVRARWPNEGNDIVFTK
ncbi:MAG: hypothetical protein D6743_01930 [Calditrichaeota bacterium]|nr:MAG: hypothetical protein D6743_01930 [Calditrichota bacterium]